MENKFEKIILKNISQVNLQSNINLDTCSIYTSPYQNISLLLKDNIIIYIGKYISQENIQINYQFEKISKINNSNIIPSQKYIICDFTQNYIYLITEEKNEILISDYTFPQILLPLSGILPEAATGHERTGRQRETDDRRICSDL